MIADDRADITDLRRRIDTEAIPHLTQALNLPNLSADLLLRLDTSGAPGSSNSIIDAVESPSSGNRDVVN